MKIVAIGDIHGRDAWHRVETSLYDKIVFIGDYVDSRERIPDQQIVQNLKDIIAFKKVYPAEVVLLLGNHDIQYLYYPEHKCSGFRNDLLDSIRGLFLKNEDLFQVAYQYQDYLFTHAGVSKGWYTRHQGVLNKYVGENLGETLNKVHQSVDWKVLFEVGEARGGDYDHGGPIWADKSETQDQSLDSLHQVVGHSRVEDIITYGDDTSSITYIDVLSTQVKFFEVQF